MIKWRKECLGFFMLRFAGELEYWREP
jgi:hypothetical protein